MNGLAWLNDIAAFVRCANCNTAYLRENVSVVGNRDDRYYLRCICHKCGTQGIGVVFVAALPKDAPSITPPLTVDDVLDAHNVLGPWRGDLAGLLA